MTAHVQLTERETLALLDCVRQADAQRVHYPPHLLSARRAAFLAQIARRGSIESRLAAIDAALGSGLDTETVNNLLEEKAEILTMLGKE
jgi:hypothetical protein